MSLCAWRVLYRNVKSGGISKKQIFKIAEKSADSRGWGPYRAFSLAGALRFWVRCILMGGVVRSSDLK